ncbi:MAG: ABC transporter substrate-binding protein [Bilophila wadsworthia]
MWARQAPPNSRKSPVDGRSGNLPIWYAKQKGWDKEVGLDVELLYSAPAWTPSAPARQDMVFGGMGAIPALMGALRHDTYVIANCNDEAMVNAVMVRPDSPIMQTKGYNKSYPNVYGTPESVKGKTVLCTTVSSAHFALSSWLKALGLTEKDVTIKNMDQASALAAFEYGIGDIVTLWAPLTYVGEKRGWKVASTPHDCYRGLPIVIVADREFADKNPEVTAKF